MKRCHRYKDMIEDFLAGQLASDKLAVLREHSDGCPDCADQLALHDGLLRNAEEIPEPHRSELRNMREAVLDRVTRNPPPASRKIRRRGFWPDLVFLWRFNPVASSMALLTLLAISALLGRWSSPSPTLDEDMLLQAINQQATRESNRGEYWDAPLSFNNVAVRPQADGQLALSFDVSHHVEVLKPRSSALAREVLLHAILEPSSMGSRFGAMELTPEIPDHRLKEALILTMHEDPSLTVRLNALAVLSRYPKGPQTQSALLHTLGQDPEVQMRLMALEQLAAQEVGMETIQRVVIEAGLESDFAVLQRASALNRTD